MTTFFVIPFFINIFLISRSQMRPKNLFIFILLTITLILIFRLIQIRAWIQETINFLTLKFRARAVKFRSSFGYCLNKLNMLLK